MCPLLPQLAWCLLIYEWIKNMVRINEVINVSSTRSMYLILIYIDSTKHVLIYLYLLTVEEYQVSQPFVYLYQLVDVYISMLLYTWSILIMYIKLLLRSQLKLIPVTCHFQYISMLCVRLWCANSCHYLHVRTLNKPYNATVIMITAFYII